MDQSVLSERGSELFYRHMALILIANSDFRILLKVHCNGSDVKSLAAKALELTGTSDEGLPDFIKELANLLGGPSSEHSQPDKLREAVRIVLSKKGNGAA